MCKQNLGKRSELMKTCYSFGKFVDSTVKTKPAIKCTSKCDLVKETNYKVHLVAHVIAGFDFLFVLTGFNCLTIFLYFHTGRFGGYGEQ